MKSDWFKEQARDLIAVGSLPFLALTVARVSVMDVYYPAQFIVSSILFFALNAFFRAEFRAGVAFILLIFTSLYYRSMLFAVFAFCVYAGIVAALLYLHRETKKVATGILLGALSSWLGYTAVKLIFHR